MLIFFLAFITMSKLEEDSPSDTKNSSNVEKKSPRNRTLFLSFLKEEGAENTAFGDKNLNNPLDSKKNGRDNGIKCKDGKCKDKDCKDGHCKNLNCDKPDCKGDKCKKNLCEDEDCTECISKDGEKPQKSSIKK